MRHATVARAIAAVAVASLMLSGCGGGSNRRLPKDLFGYDAAKPLLVQVSGTSVRGPVAVRSLTYAAADGSKVPALFAVPRNTKAVACLMYQPGVGTAKEAAAGVWPSAAKRGVAVFTIDPRDTGARPGGPGAIQAISNNPDTLASYFRSNVIDLRRGLDYLEAQPPCHHNVGYMGISEGAVFGVLLAGADSRIRATVLCSIGATWRARLFYSPHLPRAIANDPAKLSAAVAALARLDQARWIAKISPRPVMIVDGLADPAIPPVDALDLAAAARGPKTIVLTSGGHDPFAAPEGRANAAKIDAFLTKNLIHDKSAA